MNHDAFVAAYTSGAVKIEVDPAGAARFLSARLLLPFVAMPVAGAGVALALVGWIYTGLAVIAAAIVVPRLIKRSAPHFVLTQALQDKGIYDEVTLANILRVTSSKEEG